MTNDSFFRSDEELQCLADWKEGPHHYLVGKLKRDRTIPSNEEAYRCFMYEKMKDGSNGYNVAISGDATCTGMPSPTEGEIRLVLTKGIFAEIYMLLLQG